MEDEKKVRLSLEKSNVSMILANRPHNVIQMQSHVVFLPKKRHEYPGEKSFGVFLYLELREQDCLIPGGSLFLCSKAVISETRKRLKVRSSP